MMRKRHIIDMLFPVALFLVLAASSLFVVILAANVYRKNVVLEEENYEGRTCLSYVAEKIRQSDENGGIAMGTLEDIPCLMLCRELGGQTYITYLYSYEGTLRELFVQEGVSVKPSDGQEILRVNDLQIAKQEEGIFRIACTDESGLELVTYAAVVSSD